MDRRPVNGLLSREQLHSIARQRAERNNDGHPGAIDPWILHRLRWDRNNGEAAGGRPVYVVADRLAAAHDRPPVLHGRVPVAAAHVPPAVPFGQQGIVMAAQHRIGHPPPIFRYVLGQHSPQPTWPYHFFSRQASVSSPPEDIMKESRQCNVAIDGDLISYFLLEEPTVGAVGIYIDGTSVSERKPYFEVR